MFKPRHLGCRESLKHVLLVLPLWLGLITPSLPIQTKAAEPRIDYIEPFLTNQVLIHFDTEANRTYILQYTASLSTTSRWSNMFTGFAFPFPNHYVVLDTNAAPQRFYRLSVKP